MYILYYFRAFKKTLHFEQYQTYIKVTRKSYKKLPYTEVPLFSWGICSKTHETAILMNLIYILCFSIHIDRHIYDKV